MQDMQQFKQIDEFVVMRFCVYVIAMASLES